ncbi:aminopeptidase P family protein [Raoultibacter phocaeensis]|uniref:aminopeptidase P family protein n=1 Tax=Raoultibacter phocaeensis TaxID=2479841 RepID=UPI001119DE1F|nr:aminopeptidase P family protein [Raoultibacter phocaeensis]
MSCSNTTRSDRLRAAASECEADAFYVRNQSNLRWLTAFDGVFDDEDAHAMVVTRRRAVLHTDSRYGEAFRRAASGGVIEIDGAGRSHAAFASDVLGHAVRGAAAEGGEAHATKTSMRDEAAGEASATVTRLAIETTMELGEFRALEKVFADSSVELVETSGVIVKLRAVKDAGEVARMRVAQAITDAAFSHIAAFMKPGMTEREVQIELEDFMVRHGAEGLAFPSIVATGANGASPHAIPGETVLEAGQCVVLDFGARAQGYCSDMTRMVFLGEPDERMRRAYETIREANERVQAALMPGVTGAQMHQLAEDVLAHNGFGGKMGHGLGHGVGIDIHEEPVLSPRNPLPLVAGNVVTVEPGIYLADEFGMRLEDFGVITDDGFDAFTRSTHEMVIV